MSLYHEAAKILETTKSGDASIKSLVYSKTGWKSDPKALFALSTEAAKWSEVLAEVLERSGVLKIDRQLSPILALVLTYDLFLSKRGIALPASHGLNAAISKHKARLSAELTKARLRRGFATVEALRATINNGSVTTAGGESQPVVLKHPRWIRINTLKTNMDEQLASTFAGYKKAATVHEVMTATASSKIYHLDEHIPNLLAIPTTMDVTSSKAYRIGQLILQDKASCFPAYLLDAQPSDGDVIDACAAPGNKTTHLAAILGDGGKVIACEKDVVRSQTLEKMVKLAGAEGVVTVKSKQDFTKLPPNAKAFANVGALLLDPSCSGSGIVGRDEGSGITVHLPDPRASADTTLQRSKKRKRTLVKPAPTPEAAVEEADEEEAAPPEESEDKLAARLANLSAFQLRLLQHAMSFPSARRIAYSTCSVHAEENEHVVVAALRSEISRERGWRVLRRDEQVDGMRKWRLRGMMEAVGGSAGDVEGQSVKEIAEACIRCDKHGEDGTMGFFVVGFVRDADLETGIVKSSDPPTSCSDEEQDENEWDGFGDEA